MKSRAHLVIQTAFLGDLILSIPWLSRLRKISNEQQIVLVCKKGLGEYFLKEKIVDQVYEVTKGDRSIYQKIVKSLNEQYEIENLFCVHRSTRSLLFANQIQAKRKIGFSSFLGFWIFDDIVNYEVAWPDPLRQWNLLSVVDSESSYKLLEQDWQKLNSKQRDASLPKVPTFFQFPIKNKFQKTDLKKVALFPGSVWATKKWTEDGFIELAKRLSSLDYQIEIMGGPEEKELAARICDQIPNARNLAGQLSLTDSIYHLRGCSLVISNDSAPTHMASCENIPVVSIFGPTTLDLGFRPWSNQSRIAEINLSCRPCGKHGHHQCPLGHHRCMKNLLVDQVFAECIELLKTNSNFNLSSPSR